MKYIPDKWVLLEITNADTDTHKRVFGTWFDTDSWRMNSGVTKTVEKKKHYNFHGESGSVYKCYKGREGVGAYTNSVLQEMIKDAEKVGCKIEVISV